jgi:hypothetical protein
MGSISIGLYGLYYQPLPLKGSLLEDAAVSTSQTITLIGWVNILPIILCYTAYCYYILRGKAVMKPCRKLIFATVAFSISLFSYAENIATPEFAIEARKAIAKF